MGDPQDDTTTSTSQNFNPAASGQQPPVTETDTQTPSTTKPPAEEFARATRTQTNERAEQQRQQINRDGFYLAADGRKVWTNPPEQGLGEFLDNFFQLFLLLFKDPELLQMQLDATSDNYVDIAEHYAKLRNGELYQVLSDPTHPDNQLKIDELREKYGDSVENMKTHATALFNIILSKESGGDLNVVWDYRNRVGSDGRYSSSDAARKQYRDAYNNGNGFTGFKPGDTTPKGLYVGIVLDKETGEQVFKASEIDESKHTVIPFSEAKIKHVMAWQKEYLNEQKALGFPANKRSTALGAFQFTYTTLNEMTKPDKDTGIPLLNPEAKFDQQGQLNAAVVRMMTARGMDDFINGQKSTGDMIKGLRNEWEGLWKVDDQKLAQALNDIKTNPTLLASTAPGTPGGGQG